MSPVFQQLILRADGVFIELLSVEKFSQCSPGSPMVIHAHQPDNNEKNKNASVSLGGGGGRGHCGNILAIQAGSLGRQGLFSIS